MKFARVNSKTVKPSFFKILKVKIVPTSKVKVNNASPRLKKSDIQFYFCVKALQ